MWQTTPGLNLIQLSAKNSYLFGVSLTIPLGGHFGAVASHLEAERLRPESKRLAMEETIELDER
jgi:hypothetical protein